MSKHYPIRYAYKICDTQAPSVVIPARVEAALRRSLENRQVEQGGILGASSGEISHFIPDTAACCDQNLFQPSVEMNRVIAQWSQQGIAFAGLIHSHPADQPQLSIPDLMYVTRLLQENPQLPAVIMGIMAGQELLLYGFERDFLPPA